MTPSFYADLQASRQHLERAIADTVSDIDWDACRATTSSPEALQAIGRLEEALRNRETVLRWMAEIEDPSARPRGPKWSLA